jgi:hypothetical protein
VEIDDILQARLGKPGWLKLPGGQEFLVGPSMAGAGYFNSIVITCHIARGKDRSNKDQRMY